MADMRKIMVFTLLILVVFSFVVSFVSDGNIANGGLYNTNYPTMARVSQYTSTYQNLTTSFRTQASQNQAQNGNSVLGALLNAYYGLQYNIAIATMSLTSFTDIASGMVNDAGGYFVMIPFVVVIIVGIYVILQIALAIANVVKGGPL